MKIIKWFFLLSSFSLINAGINAQLFTTQNSYAEFRANATFNSYKGVSKQLEGSINTDTKKFSFKIPIKSLDTDNNKRNKDMFELMKVEKYPYAEYSGSIVSGFSPTAEGKQVVEVSGNFTLRGVTKPLKIKATINRKGNVLQVESTFDLYITNFNIDPPNILINKVKDKHVIYIKATLNKQG